MKWFPCPTGIEFGRFLEEQKKGVCHILDGEGLGIDREMLITGTLTILQLKGPVPIQVGLNEIAIPGRQNQEFIAREFRNTTLQFTFSRSLNRVAIIDI